MGILDSLQHSFHSTLYDMRDEAWYAEEKTLKHIAEQYVCMR